MAELPIPQTRSQILGSLMSTFLSKYGLDALRAGDPVLSLLEVIAQSELRVSDDIFSMLRGIALEVATGEALDRIGADELTSRLTAKAATGFVTVGDSSFAKIATTIFQGTSPVIVGSSSINITDGSAFESLVGTQYIYLGRNTTNYEGPIQISSVDTPSVTGGNYWRINLASPTTRYHALGESVILAQGGDREIAAGTIVSTAQGPLSSPVQYSVLYTVTLEDGEVELQNVQVRCTLPGLTGNAIKNGIVEFVTAPFDGATVTNPSPFTNGRNLERDEGYRERIRLKRRSRSLGTITALKAYTLGVESPDENAVVVSNSLVTRIDGSATLYVDDGGGYEERHLGIAQEILVDQALGGEDYFKTSQQPISKAVSLTTLVAPFVLTPGRLAFKVGGVLTEHVLDTSQFSSLGSVSAYELCASINSDAGLLWAARTYNGGTQVAVFAKAETNDDVQWVEASEQDLNGYLGFSSERIYTTSLYKNDLMLSKDGQLATVYSRSFNQWGSMSGNQTLTMEIDGIAMEYGDTAATANFSYFTDQDFIDAETGYTTLGRNSLAAWAKVLNYRVPGITVTVVGDKLALTSNRDRDDLASVWTKSGTLVTAGMFNAEEDTDAFAQGVTQDYILNRSTGEIYLKEPLAEGDSLSLGTPYTRAFLQTSAITATTFSADAKMWFVLDGQAEVIPTGYLVGQTVTLTNTESTANSSVQRLANTSIAAHAEIGDWLIVWDSALSAVGISGSYRISNVDPTWVEFEKVGAGVASAPVLVEGGLAVVRTVGQVQELTLPAVTGSTNTYTASTVASATDLNGLKAQVYRTNYVRFTTQSFGLERDIALVAQNTPAVNLGLTPADYTANIQGHLGSVESGNSLNGTPLFQSLHVSANGSLDPDIDNWVAMDVYATPPSHYVAQGLFSESLVSSRWGSNWRFLTPLESVTGTTTLTMRQAGAQSWVVNNRLTLTSPYALAYDDYLNLIVDQDSDFGRYAVPFNRKLTPSTSTYGATNTFYDADNANSSLTAAFGYGADVFDFKDFAVWMASRVKIVQNATILWRYNRLGPDGDGMEVTYKLPAAPDSEVALEVDAEQGNDTRLNIVLGSGALRTGYNLPDNYYLGTVAPTTNVGGMTSVYYITGLKVISYQRTANAATVRLQFPDATVTDSGLAAMAVKLFNFQTLSAAPSAVWNFASAVFSEWVPASGIFDKVVFSQTGADVPLVAGNVGVMYFTATQTASFLGGGPAVAQYDYLRANLAAGLGANFSDLTASIQNVPGTDLYHLKVLVPNFGSTSTTITYGQIVDPSEFTIFANANMTGTDLVADVNDLEGVLNGTVITNGSNVITLSTEEFQNDSDPVPVLADGVNYVLSTNSPALLSDNYTFTFKNAITGSLATNSDWLNEEIRLVPTTVKNVVDWMGVLGVTGLSSVAEIAASNGGFNTQIATRTQGSLGSIAILGGKANSATAALIGSSSEVDDVALTLVRTADTTGLFRGSWVALDNTEGLDKTGSLVSSGTTMAFDPLGTITFDVGTSLFTELVAASQAELQVQYQKVGDFVLISDTGLGSNTIVGNLGTVSEGDYVQVKTATAPVSGTPVNDLNKGLFRVVRVDSAEGLVWIENPNAVDQPEADLDLRFFTADSIVPGNYIRIDTSLFGTANQGVWLITDVGTDFATDNVLTVEGTLTAASTTALGGQSAFVHFTDIPYRAIKQIYSISESNDEGYSYVKLVPSTGYEKMGAAGGTVMTALDKLDFDLGVNTGLDGYQHSTGLIQEVNRVVYGDLSNPTVYPGVAATNSRIAVDCSIVRRITMGFQARTYKGFSKEIIANKIRNAAAGIINALNPGQAVSISAVLQQVQRISGLFSLVVLSPTYNSANDLIKIQPYERARVLNPDVDITVVFVGE